MPQFSQSIDDGGSINLLNEAFASTNYQQFQPGKLSKPKPFNPSTTAREANVSQTYIDQLKQLRKGRNLMITKTSMGTDKTNNKNNVPGFTQYVSSTQDSQGSGTDRFMKTTSRLESIKNMIDKNFP